jgi:hypothetical protein
MNVLETEEWRALVALTDLSQQRALGDKILDRLSDADVEMLLERSQNGSANEQRAALGILMDLRRRAEAASQPYPESFRELRQRARTLMAPHEAAWRTVVRGLAVDQFPSTLVGIRSMQAWREADLTGAGAFMLDTFEAGRITDERGAVQVVLQLNAIESPKVVSRLEALPPLPGRAEAERWRALEARRPPTEMETMRLARAWRRRRTPKTLSAFYYRCIARAPLPLMRREDVRRLLGRPSSEAADTWWYFASDGCSVSLTFGSDGYVSGSHIT